MKMKTEIECLWDLRQKWMLDGDEVGRVRRSGSLGYRHGYGQYDAGSWIADRMEMRVRKGRDL
jgi:hypothetical protein